MKKLLLLLCFVLALSGCMGTSVSDDNEINSPDTEAVISTDAQTPEGGEEKPIEDNEESDEISFNNYYFTLIGMPKSQVDELLGESEYDSEWRLSSYSCGVSYGWEGTMGTTPALTDKATCMYVKLKDFINNCPDSLTNEDLGKIFTNYHKSYNEMDEENVIVAEVDGKCLILYPDLGLNKDDSAFFNVYNPYYAE